MKNKLHIPWESKKQLDLAGRQMQKGIRYQYRAIGCATASVDLFIRLSFMQDDYQKNYSKKSTSCKLSCYLHTLDKRLEA